MKLPKVTESIVYGTKPLIVGEDVKWRGSKTAYAAFNTAQHELESSIEEYRRVSTLPTADMNPSEARAHQDALRDIFHGLALQAESVLEIRHQLIQTVLDNSADYIESGEDAEIEKVANHFAKIGFDASCLPVSHRDVATAERQFQFMIRCVPTVRQEMEAVATRRAKIIHLRKDLPTTGKHLANCSASAISIASPTT